MSQSHDSREFNLAHCSVQGELIASTIKSHLESEGIPVYLKQESIGRVLGLNVDGLGQVDIMVSLEFEEEAKQIIMPGLEENSL